MKRLRLTDSTTAHALRAGLVAMLAALALAGCGKQKVTSVDPAYTVPEGRLSADARLIVYPDAPITIEHWTDNGPTGPDPTDVMIGTSQARLLSPGALHGAIFDGTPASGYQVLRRESNGGLLPLKDFVLRPERRFLDSQYELYTFDDPTPSGFTPASYIGRGVVSDAVTPLSPLTNQAATTGSTIDTIRYVGNRSPTDTLISMKWTEVAGAAGYWLHVYQNKGGPESRIRTSLPAPFARPDTRDFFLAYVAAPADSYKIGNPGALVLTRRVLLTGVEYLVRVSAVNAEGRLLAYTYGDQDLAPGDDTYRKFTLGAAKVQPRRLGGPEPSRATRASNGRLP